MSRFDGLANAFIPVILGFSPKITEQEAADIAWSIAIDADEQITQFEAEPLTDDGRKRDTLE